MTEENNLTKIYIHPIFKSLFNHFDFFLVGINMLIQQDFQKALILSHKGQKSILETTVNFPNKQILYDVRDIIELFKREASIDYLPNGKIHARINKLVNFQARPLAISLFDILQNSKYSRFLNKTNLFRFAKHIRNGAAHNNKFTFDEPLKSPIKWNNKTIVNSLKGKPVFPSFITPADLIILASDISKELHICDLKINFKAGRIEINKGK